jgi:hydrogenase expression/formation protein HypE
MHQLIDTIFSSTFARTPLAQRHDAVIFPFGSSMMAFTTDSYVIHPLFFPGGDIGRLAVYGTVNDLAMCGARPLYLSVGMIFEEGLLIEDVWKISRSLEDAAYCAGVQIVTGDTKVVDKGKGDGLFINTSGIGIIEHDKKIHPQQIRPGDVIIVNGDIGRHGIAVMALREGLEFESTIESDLASLSGIVQTLLSAGIEIHCMRDLTRGGLASALNELAEAAEVGIEIDETEIPVRQDVAAACEMLGLDPLYVANEGRFVAFVAPEEKNRTLDIMKCHPLGKEASVIGKVSVRNSVAVTVKSKIGTKRILGMLSGEQLPRIC